MPLPARHAFEHGYCLTGATFVAVRPNPTVSALEPVCQPLGPFGPFGTTTTDHAIDVGNEPLPPVDRSTRRFTVLDVTKWFGETSGGVRTYLQQKSNYVLARPDLRHVLVIPAARDLVTDAANVRWYRLRGPRIPTQRQYRFLLAARSLRRIIAHEAPDVIEVGSPVFVPWVVALAARGRRVPMISFYHTNLLNCFPAARPATLLRPALRFYARRLDRLFETTLVASRFAADDLAGAGLDRVSLVPLGVDLETFAPWRGAHAGRTRARLDLPPDERITVFAGRFAPEKELEVAIDAWRMAEDTLGTLVLMGDGPVMAALRRRAAGAAIRFLPFENSRERVADLLAASDAYIAPSPVETFGLAALEALACGTPVVSADRGGVAERVERSKAGLTFRAGSAESLVHAMRRLFGGQPEQLGRIGRTFVEREHGWNAVFDEIFDVYRQVAAP